MNKPAIVASFVIGSAQGHGPSEDLDLSLGATDAALALVESAMSDGR